MQITFVAHQSWTPSGSDPKRSLSGASDQTTGSASLKPKTEKTRWLIQVFFSCKRAVKATNVVLNADRADLDVNVTIDCCISLAHFHVVLSLKRWGGAGLAFQYNVLEPHYLAYLYGIMYSEE